MTKTPKDTRDDRPKGEQRIYILKFARGAKSQRWVALIIFHFFAQSHPHDAP